MADIPTLNTDLEQALHKAVMTERNLRLRARLYVVLPIVAGALWLLYSYAEVNAWQKQSQEIDARKAAVEQREADARRQITEIEAQRDKAEARARTVEEEKEKAQAQVADIRQRLVATHTEVGSLAVLLNDLNSARAKASKLMASEAVESQIGEIRTALARGLGRIGQEIDIAVPASEQKPYVYVFINDEQQRGAASQLKTQLEASGFDVSIMAKSYGRRFEDTEVHYFREPEDKTEAARIADILAKQTGQTDAKIMHTPDPDHTNGTRKFQILLGKSAAPASRQD